MKNGEVQYISHVKNGRDPRPGFTIGPQVEGHHHNEYSRLSETVPMSGAADICTRAAGLVAGDRDIQYGDKVTNFTHIASLWSAYLEMPISPEQAAMCMALLKVARTKSKTFHADNYVDLAGYAGCAGEIAERTR